MNKVVATIKEITKLEGEASANNRKAKLIFFYEWVITGEWEGNLKKSENKTVYKGNFEVPNLSEEHDPSEIDINVTIKNEKQFDLKEFMRIEGGNKIREQFARYLVLLREEFSQGLIKPTKDTAGNMPATTVTTKPASDIKLTSVTTSTNGHKINESVKIDTKKLTMKEEFKCRASELYNVFTDINVISLSVFFL